MVVREVDEEILSGHQLHDGVAQELHPLVVAPGRGKQQEVREKWGIGEKKTEEDQQQETQLMPRCSQC